MFYNPTFIKTMSIVALVLFILAMIVGILVTAAGFSFMDSSGGYLESAAQGVSPEDPGAGWLFLGKLFGSLTASFLSAFVAVVGILCILGGLIVYLPAFIAFIVYKYSKNVTAYWILMGVWLALLLACIIMAVFC